VTPPKYPIARCGDTFLTLDSARRPATYCRRHQHGVVWPSLDVAAVAAARMPSSDWCPQCATEAARPVAVAKDGAA
jgi:hypothetical protein